MGNRLTKKQKYAIVGGGCVFAALAAAFFMMPGASAATSLSTTMAMGGYILGGSEVQWAASSWNMTDIPPLACTQEVLTGSYVSSVNMKDASYTAQQDLNNTETILFTEQTDVSGDGIFGESMMLDSCGAPSTGVLCGSLDATNELEAENITATAYCERVIGESLFMGQGIKYKSLGVIGQADDTILDSFDMAMIGEGESGVGTIGFSATTMAGIDTTDMLGYTNRIKETITAGGTNGFGISKEIHWTSFMNSFGVSKPPRVPIEI